MAPGWNRFHHKPVSSKPVSIETGFARPFQTGFGQRQTGFVCLSKPVFAKFYKTIISFELELISAVSNPKGVNRALSIRIRAQYVFSTKRYVFVRIRAYLRYGEPEGGKPSALYQNPGTMSLFAKTIWLHSELISAISSPKGGNRAPSIRIRPQ